MAAWRVKTTFPPRKKPHRDMSDNGLDPEEKLRLLQRLDQFRRWRSTHDRRLCLGCGKLISGTEIRLARSMEGQGLLGLRCPTEDCTAGPMDWVEPAAR
jgi:hypothetical protein